MTITASIDQWTLRYNGGRTGDIFHAESDTALDCVQVGAYDWQHGKLLSEPTPESIRETLAEWIAESGPDYARELPYLL